MISSIIISLLIVPCGIETDEQTRDNNNLVGLLIVPCGIETRSDGKVYCWDNRLLIVPCGIETIQRPLEIRRAETF